MGINLPGESRQKRWPSKIFGAMRPENGWAAKLTGDTENMFIQLKTPRHDEISISEISGINYFA